MAHKALHQGRCKPVFPDMQNLTGGKTEKQPQEKYFGAIFKRQYGLRLSFKTGDSQVARVKFLWETGNKRAQWANAFTKKDINDLHAHLGHPSIWICLTGMFRLWENCALGKAKKGFISKKAVVCSKILAAKIYFDISSPLTPTFGDKKHLLLVVEDSTNYAWSNF